MDNLGADNDESNVEEITQANMEIDRILELSLAHSKTENADDPQYQRYCWVCFATEDDEDSEGQEWIKPCNCNKFQLS
jgi:hypothetical protein